MDAIHGCDDKRTITATFVITLAGEFLPIQLIYGGKTLQSLPRYQFPNSFSLSVNEKHYSNRNESLKLFNEIVIPYINEIRSSQNIPDQYALVIMDVFTGQKTTKVINLLKDNKILVTNIPANMTRFYQPLDLTVNGYAKKFMSRKLNSWCTHQISLRLEKGVPIDQIDIKLGLSLMKPLHAEWVTNFYNHITTLESKKIIKSGWLSSGVPDAIRLGLNKLPSNDPFGDIAPMTDILVLLLDYQMRRRVLDILERKHQMTLTTKEMMNTGKVWTFKIAVHLTFSMISTTKIKFKL